MGFLSSGGDSNKPHAVCIPYPAQGHINPMTKLARLLHHRGFHITFVHTDFNYRRLLRSRGPSSVAGLPSFRFESIPDGLPPSDADATQDISALSRSVDRNCAGPFKELLLKLEAAAANDIDGEVPPVSCVFSDGLMPFTLDVTEDIGIVNVMLWTASASGFLAYAMYRQLVDKGIIPLKDAIHLTNGYLDTIIEWAPKAFEGIRLRDMPSFIRTTDPNEIMVNYLISCVERSHRAAAIIFNTYDALEGQFLSTLRTTTSLSLPPLYTCGPFNLLLDQISKQLQGTATTTTTTTTNSSSASTSLWKEDDNCIKWLDSKDPESVVYINFGSITVVTKDQLVEFAWGLAITRKPFLWVIRPDLVSGDSAILPPEFVAETSERGLLASWCDQECVLNHPAVGVFLTHSGWNSTLESIMNGVPMICWPFFAEQQTNCWYCRQLGIAMEIDTDVKREEVVKLVNEVMDSHLGLEMKNKAKEWKKLAHEAVVEDEDKKDYDDKDEGISPRRGGSFLNFTNLINQVLLPN